MAESKLIEVHVPSRPQAAVLVLHGGGSREKGVAVSPTQLSVLRMIPIARRVARADRRRLAVFRVLNSVRGWDTDHTPADDVTWALGQVAERLGDLPVGLVGHSLGGRAAIVCADRPTVTSVVALAPWVYADDGAVDAGGVRVLIAHGTQDRVASPERSAAAAERMRATAKSLSYVRVAGAKHAMLARHGVFSDLAARFTAAVLLDPPPRTSHLVTALVDGSPDPIDL